MLENHLGNVSGMQVWGPSAEVLIQSKRERPRILFPVNTAGDCGAVVLRSPL